MAYTAPTTRSTSDLITASIWNTDIVDNIIYLNSKINSNITILGRSMSASATSGAALGTLETTTNKLNLVFMDFSDSTSKLYAEIGFPMPDDYAGGTITAKFHWTANSTSTNSVVWGLQGVAFGDDSAIDAAFGTAQEVTDANKSTAYDLNITAATPAITIAGTPAAGKFVQFRAYRDSANGSDTLAATARLWAIVITYTRS